MRIAITGFLREGSRSGHLHTENMSGELLLGSKQLKIGNFFYMWTNQRILLRKNYIYISFIIKTIHLAIKKTYSSYDFNN